MKPLLYPVMLSALDNSLHDIFLNADVSPDEKSFTALGKFSIFYSFCSPHS